MSALVTQAAQDTWIARTRRDRARKAALAAPG
jgi:hypothetical protein